MLKLHRMIGHAESYSFQYISRFVTSRTAGRSDHTKILHHSTDSIADKTTSISSYQSSIKDPSVVDVVNNDSQSHLQKSDRDYGENVKTTSDDQDTSKKLSIWSRVKSVFSGSKKSANVTSDINSLATTKSQNQQAWTHTGDIHRTKIPKTETSVMTASDLTSNVFSLPPLKLLSKAPESHNLDDEEKLLDLSLKLRKVLADFGVSGDIVAINSGPVVNLFEFKPAPGTKTSKIIALERDIARSLEMSSARVAIVRGKNAVGIELPNACRQTIHLSELLSKQEDMCKSGSISLALGKGIDGNSYFADLCKMPHLLVAGTTGSGKSVAINTMLLSILFRLSPAQCRLILIDPKMLELAFYNDIPHLLIPVVVDPKQAILALQWVVREMERRYLLMSKIHARDIISYNHKLTNLGSREYEKLIKHDNPQNQSQYLSSKPEALPYIVVVIDELADLMLVAGRDIESAIQRLSQMARAAGIHLIVATQRPSVDVITGTIKANFSTRISFQVSSKIDSRTILGDTGAEQLLGAGDMLLMAGAGRITRLHGSFVSEHEVESVNNFLRKNYKVNYAQDVTAALNTNTHRPDQAVDELYDRAVGLIKSQGKCSTSMLQRHFQIGYNRAARIVDDLEDQGVVSSPDRTGKRQIL